MMQQRNQLRQKTALSRALVVLLCILITAAFSLPTAMPAKAAGGTMSGSGTESDPYLVEDATDFAAMSADAGTYYKLTKDIAITAPYGSSSQAFCGNFDGGGHTITATIEGSSNYTGLFAKLGSGAQISNLTLNGSIKSTSSNRRAYTGGITAYANGTIAIRNCVNHADVEGNKAVGGIAGYSGGGVSIDRCGNTGKIYARNSQAGGIVGDADSGVTNISNCFNTGNISTAYSYAGGFVGQAAKSYAQETLTNCYSTGTCTAGSNPGSLMGLSSSKGTVTNCYVLNTAAEKPVGSDNHNVIAGISIKTAEEMTSADFVKLLGDAFEMGSDGYPVIKSTAAPQPAEPFKVTFDPDGGKINGSEIVDAQSVEKDGTAADPGTPEKEGYEFTGWYNGDKKYDFSTPVTSDLTLTAKWEKVKAEYTVKFDLGGGKVYTTYPETVTEVPEQKVKEGEKIDVSTYQLAYPLPPKTGYMQGGWYNGTEKFDIKADVVTSDMTLKYKWTIGTYHVSFNIIDSTTKNAVSDPGVKITYETEEEDDWTGDSYTVTKTLKPDTDGTYHMNQGTTYSYQISANGYKAVSGAITPAGDDIDVTQTVELEKLSEEYTKLKKIADKFSGGASYTLLRAKYGTDTNVNTMIKSIIDKYDIDTSDVNVSLESTEDQSVIAANGDIAYSKSAIPNISKIYTSNVDVKVKFTCGKEEIKDVNARVQVGWDLAYFKDNMQAEADQLAFDKIKGSNDSAENIASDLTLPRTITSGGVTEGNSMQRVWSEVEWTSDSDAITITKPRIDSSIYPATGTIHRGAVDQEVTLTAKFKANDTLLNSYVGETVDRLGYITKEFKVTVKADPEKAAAVKEDLQKKLDGGMKDHGLRDAETDEPVDKDNITGNFDFPRTKDFKYTDENGEIHAVDGKYQPVTIKSDNEDVIKDQGVNAPRVLVYRPLPGEDAKVVNLTITITDKETGISVSKTVKVTVQPLTSEEIENDKALMKKAVSGYWDGIKNANTDQDNVTSDLHPFEEIVAGTDGEVKYLYNANEKTDKGISADTYKENLAASVDDPGYNDSDYRRFNSSVKTVIADSSLLVTKPQYDTEVTVDSYLTDNVYGKYYVKAKKEGNQKAMALFADLYRQHAEATVTVKGTNGKDPNPQEKINVSMKIDGLKGDIWLAPKAVKVDKNAVAADVVEKILKENGYTYEGSMNYISAITSPKGQTLTGGDKAYGKYSGWMFTVNGEFPADSNGMGYTLDTCPLDNGDVIRLFYQTGQEWNVVFDLDGGKTSDGSGSVTQSVYDGQTVKAPAAVKEGYTFDGWYSGDKNFDVGAPVYSDITLKAKWTKEDKQAEPKTPATSSKAKIFASGSYDAKKILVKWNHIKGASGYEVYVATCGSKGKLAQKKYLAKTVKKGSSVKASLKTMRSGKKFSAKNTYKVQVKAYRMVSGKKQYVSSSPAIHFVSTKNAKYTNAKKVTAGSKVVSLKRGKTKKISVKAYKQAGKKKWMKKTHGNRMRYYTTDSSVAAIGKTGRITAKGKGTCMIYAMALNGVKANVKVEVK